jgi:hypothetical protein
MASARASWRRVRGKGRGVLSVMANTMRSTLPGAPPKPLKMRGESSPEFLRIEQNGREIGQALDRALAATGWKKEAAAEQMGYGENQTSLGNWIAGRENPQLAKLKLLGAKFWREYLAQMLDAEPGVRMRRVIEIDEAAS